MINESGKKAIARLISENRSFLISGHVRPDADCIGSQLALYHALKRLGRSVEMWMPCRVPDTYLFLPGSESILMPTSADGEFDVAIALDTPNPERLGWFGEKISKMPKLVNIDHHPSNSYWGRYNWVDKRASATAEFIYLLLKELGLEIDITIATCLYAGVITDTGRFCNRNTTQFSHRVVAELIGCGVSPGEMADKIYARNRPEKIKLLGYVLSSLQVDKGVGLAWLWIKREMYKKSGAGPDDTEGFINYARDLVGVKVAALMEERADGKSVRISLRSRDKRIDVNAIAAKYGGGGHAAAAGATIEGEPRSVEANLLKEVRSAIRRAK